MAFAGKLPITLPVKQNLKHTKKFPTFVTEQT